MFPDVVVLGLEHAPAVTAGQSRHAPRRSPDRWRPPAPRHAGRTQERHLFRRLWRKGTADPGTHAFGPEPTPSDRKRPDDRERRDAGRTCRFSPLPLRQGTRCPGTNGKSTTPELK